MKNTLENLESNDIIKAIHPLKNLSYESKQALSDITTLLYLGDIDADLVHAILLSFSLSEAVKSAFVVFINSLALRDDPDQILAEDELIEILLSTTGGS